MPIPTPQQQVEFLQQLQRLLDEGQFTSTYKFALLLALATLAVDKGDDSGDELTLSVKDLAERFIELYWQQARPFVLSGTSTDMPLQQNSGAQAAIIGTLFDIRRTKDPCWRLRTYPNWNGLVATVGRVVSQMPLWKLQRVGDETVDFLYANTGLGQTITLKAGIAFCLRAFNGLVHNLVEAAWLNYVRTLNKDRLGESADIAEYLFGADRDGLAVYRPFLNDLQAGRCFYCRRSLGEKGQVDHFVPWARYPVDLGYNFVLAHQTCNGRKSDHIAAEEHLRAWTARNEQDGAALIQFCDANRLPHGSVRSQGIAHWAYTQTARINGLTWLEGQTLEHLRGDWRRLLGAA